MGNNPSHQFDGCTTLGYRVLGVQPNSPASRAGLVSFFDFLVGVNGQLLFDNGEHSDPSGDYFEDLDFIAILKDHVEKEIELLVWNIKNKTQRFITLTPSTNWDGTGLLGVTIRMDDYMTAEEKLLRVVDVKPGSPAAKAGLTPKIDYLLGTTMESFEDEDVLADVLYENEDQVLEIYVYNTETDVVRVVTIIPTLKWGGEGLLGAEVGRGYLHVLPKSCRDTLGISFERKISVHKDDHLLQVIDLDSKSDSAMECDQTSGHDNKATESAAVHVDSSCDKKQAMVDDVVVTGGTTLDNHPSPQSMSQENDETRIKSYGPSAQGMMSHDHDIGTAVFETGERGESVLDDLPPPPIAILDDNSESGGQVDLR